MNVQEQKCSGTHGLQRKGVVLGSFVLSSHGLCGYRESIALRRLRSADFVSRCRECERCLTLGFLSQVVADLGGTVYMILVYAFVSLIGWKDETTVSPSAGFTHECGAVTLGQIRKPIHISQECCIRGRNGRSIVDWPDLAYGSPSGICSTSPAPDVPRYGPT